MNRQVTREVFYNPDHVHRPSYLDFSEDDKLNGELDANLLLDKDAQGTQLFVKKRDSARYIDV